MNIVRHSRKEVVNVIEKTFKIGTLNDKNDIPKGSWTSVLGPWGAGPRFWIALVPMWPHSPPQVEFLRILSLFGVSVGGQNL